MIRRFRISYPDLTAPALHDSGHDSIVDVDSFLYEYAYRRYRDPSYLLILNQTGMHLDAHFQQFPVSVLYDRDPNEKVAPVEWKSVNFFNVGYGILRTTNAAATNSLLLEYGPDGSHGHPDKLTIDLYAFNGQLSIDPGSVWYENRCIGDGTARRWHTTPWWWMNSTRSRRCGQQLVYGFADTMGIERAWTLTAYPGVTMDRALFMTNDYVADIFGAFARLPRKLDLAWHIIGDFASDLKMEPMKFPEPVENGYVALGNVRHADDGQALVGALTSKSNVARFVAAGGTPTDVIVGDGYYGLERPPTIIERRKTNSTVYGNAIDISGAKERVCQIGDAEGGLDAGYGLLKIQTPKGTDLCFASYRPGTFKAGELESDAQQAFVQRDGEDVRAMLISAAGRCSRSAACRCSGAKPGWPISRRPSQAGSSWQIPRRPARQ